ncbi:hypothetical protein ACQ7BQ_22145, partial [Escherichia coli]
TGGTADRNRSHWSTSKTPSYTKSVSWQHHLPTYADEQCTHVLTEEDFFSTEEREGVDRCIGVICSSVSYELFPNVHEDGGVGYQFLYEGDELKCYEHGLLIESVE